MSSKESSDFDCISHWTEYVSETQSCHMCVSQSDREFDESRKFKFPIKSSWTCQRSSELFSRWAISSWVRKCLDVERLSIWIAYVSEVALRYDTYWAVLSWLYRHHEISIVYYMCLKCPCRNGTPLLSICLPSQQLIVVCMCCSCRCGCCCCFVGCLTVRCPAWLSH